VEALDRVRVFTAETRMEFRDLGTPSPGALDASEVELRLSRYVVNALSPVSGGYTFGCLEWKSIPFRDGPWAELERAACAASLAEFTSTPTEETKKS
jgi:hypothetical protein